MKRKHILWITVALVTLLGLSAFVNPGGGGVAGTQQPRSISVTGSGKVFVTPDVAYINIGVHTENSDAAQALQENSAKLQAVTDTLKGFGVDSKDIQTNNFSVYPSQQYGPSGETMGTVFAVDNTVAITVRDLNRFGEILSSVIANGANNIYGITFDVVDKSQAVTQAREAALQNATMQADELAAAAGVSLGEITLLSATTSTPTPIYADYYGRGGGAMDSATVAPVSSGQLQISVDVNVTYAIK